MSALAPKTLQFGASALLYLAAGELKPPASDALLGVKSADAIRALLRPASAGDDAAYAQTNAAIRACLKPLKFLPYETKDAQTLALLVAHRALKGEQDAVLASGSGPGAGDAENSFRTTLAARGGVLAACELVAQATSTLQSFGAVCMSSSCLSSSSSDVDDATIAEHEQAAARAVARLFRCLRVLECASFESPASCSIIASGVSHRAKNASTTKTSSVSSIELLPVVDGREDGDGGTVVPSPRAENPTTSPAKCRLPGDISDGASRHSRSDRRRRERRRRRRRRRRAALVARARGFASQRDERRFNRGSDDSMVGGERAPARPRVGPEQRPTACRALVETLATLAATTAAAVVGAKKGDDVGDVKILYDGGIAVDHRVAVGTLKSALCTLTSVTNENEEGCNAVVGDDGRGLLTIASLVPFLARNIEGFSLEDASDRRRSRTPADDSGSSLLAATLVLLVSVVEADSTTAETLRATFVSLRGARGRSRTRASPRRHSHRALPPRRRRAKTRTRRRRTPSPRRRRTPSPPTPSRRIHPKRTATI